MENLKRKNEIFCEQLGNSTCENNIDSINHILKKAQKFLNGCSKLISEGINKQQNQQKQRKKEQRKKEQQIHNPLGGITSVNSSIEQNPKSFTTKQNSKTSSLKQS